MNVTQKVGLGFSVFLTLAGLGVVVLGAVLPHAGVILAGVGIAAISGYGIYYSVKN